MTSQSSFRKIVKEKVQQKALEYLLNKKESHISENAKGKQIKYEKLKIQGYLNSSNLNISVNEKKWLFKCRVEDIDLPVTADGGMKIHSVRTVSQLK